jgi:hypothetical protein
VDTLRTSAAVAICVFGGDGDFGWVAFWGLNLELLDRQLEAFAAWGRGGYGMIFINISWVCTRRQWAVHCTQIERNNCVHTEKQYTKQYKNTEHTK